MFIRSILIPSMMVCAICSPFLISENNFLQQPSDPTGIYPDSSQAGWGGSPSQYPQFAGSASSNSVLPNSYSVGFDSQPRNVITHSQSAPLGDLNQKFSAPDRTFVPGRQEVPFGLVPLTQNVPTQVASAEELESPYSPASPEMVRLSSTPPPRNTGVPSQNFAQIVPPTGMTPMVPDPMSSQTLIYPGNEFGPDLTATPLEFLPIQDFGVIFRFDISPDWVKHRWRRISTNPGDRGLHGLRVALVTGTNSWDLHGSLTYYFDPQQRLQRISFRGWTGDATRLLQLLTAGHGFQARESLLAGFYIAQSRRQTTGALLMKEPPVIYADNPVEKLAIVLEINNPAGNGTLSEGIQLLIAGSMSQ